MKMEDYLLSPVNYPDFQKSQTILVAKNSSGIIQITPNSIN